MKPLSAARRATAASTAAVAYRDDMIRLAHDKGEPIRTIAKATGLSSARIHQILHRR